MSMPRGSRLHADWFGAWERNVLDWFTECPRQDADASGGSLCELGDCTAQLSWPDDYAGPSLLSGWTPTPERFCVR